MQRMSERHDERCALRMLIESLGAQCAVNERAWRLRMDPSVLLGYRKDLDEAAIRLRSSAVTAAATDRARSLAAEVMVANRLLAAGCEVEYEVETPNGRHVDFRATRGGASICIHVKRAPHPTLRDAVASVPAAWRTLETVPRGLVIAFSLSKNLRGKHLHAALDEAFAFLEQASVGDEIMLRDAESRPCARLRVIAPSTGGRAELVADLSASFDDHVPRFQATLRKAFAQFMPRAENLIVVCGSSGGVEAFATALLGSHIERWDKRPRAGELVAYGRGGDGFWSGSLRNQSRLAVYWALAKDNGPLLFLRESGARATAASTAVTLARSVFA
jgi:hypothetical protein